MSVKFEWVYEDLELVLNKSRKLSTDWLHIQFLHSSLSSEWALLSVGLWQKLQYCSYVMKLQGWHHYRDHSIWFIHFSLILSLIMKLSGVHLVFGMKYKQWTLFSCHQLTVFHFMFMASGKQFFFFSKSALTACHFSCSCLVQGFGTQQGRSIKHKGVESCFMSVIINN